MKKVLFVATIDQHIRHFHIPYIKWFKKNGYQVSVASHGNENIPYVDIKHEVCFERKPFKINNLKALFKLNKIIKENKYEIIHTNTPVASILVRLSNLIVGQPSKIIYTAHGFHFYNGAKLINWLVYYPIEKLLSYFTDSLITINKEDYNKAINNKFGSKNIYLIDGVGVNLDKYNKPTIDVKRGLRDKYGYRKEDFILIYTGEISARKNQKLLLDALSQISSKIENLKVLLIGKGENENIVDDLKKQCETLKLNDYVLFFGYRNDVADLMKLSDVAVSTAIQEGLPINIIESLSSGLPCVVSNCRGNRDVIKNNINGIVVDKFDPKLFSEAIYKIYKDQDYYQMLSDNCIKSVEKYSEKVIIKEMSYIYSKC